MVKLNHILAVLLGVFILSSCSTYNVVAENDVYMQRPNEINVNEDPADLTTYTAYKAGRNGAFRSHYNTSYFMGSSMFYPNYNSFGMRPFGFNNMNNQWGHPYAFHNNPYYSHGMNNWYGYNSGFDFGPGYYGHGYGFGYGNTFGNNNINFSGTNSIFSNTYYGHRNGIASSSKRSSNYPTTLKNMKNTGTSGNFQRTSTQTREITRSSGVDQSTSTREVASSEVARSNANRNRSVNQSTRTNSSRSTARNSRTGSNNARAIKPSTRSQSRLNSSYRPSNSAQRSGTITRSQSTRATGSTPTRGSSSINRGSSSNQRVSGTSRSRSSGGSVSRGGSSRSTSGSSRGSSSRRSGGRR